MRISSFLRKSIYSALVFFGTVVLLSVGYAAFNSIPQVNTGDSLTKDIWNQMATNLDDLNSRVTGVSGNLASLSGAVSSLQVSAGSLWTTVTGGIGYSGGNVGIGTSTPGSSLHVYRDTGSNAEIDIQSTAGVSKHWAVYNDRASSSLRFWNNDISGEKNILTLGNNGNVGIGVVSPETKLDVNGEVKSVNFTATDATSQSTTAGALKLNAGGGAIVLDDGGQKRISWNDGGGNFNMRAGSYVQSGVGLVYAKGISDSNGGAASITMNTDSTDGSITLATSAIGVPGSPVAWGNSLALSPTGSYFGNYVGAGVATPHAWLDVNGTFAIGGANTNKWGIWTNGANDNFGIAYVGGSYPDFSGPTHFSITKTGDVGITGTVTAAAFKGDGSALTGLPGGIPTGMVMAYNGTVCPAGWAEANGTAVPVGNGGSSTLNLRGEFVRGLDNGRNVDTGRTIATHQSGTDISIYTDNNGYVFGRNTDGAVTYSNHNFGSVGVAGTNGASSFIVRPRNVALLYCVKN